MVDVKTCRLYDLIHCNGRCYCQYDNSGRCYNHQLFQQVMLQMLLPYGRWNSHCRVDVFVADVNAKWQMEWPWGVFTFILVLRC